ncbi:hypothetical protein ACP4OV_021914 [Aristida adscensionis]
MHKQRGGKRPKTAAAAAAGAQVKQEEDMGASNGDGEEAGAKIAAAGGGRRRQQEGGHRGDRQVRAPLPTLHAHLEGPRLTGPCGTGHLACGRCGAATPASPPTCAVRATATATSPAARPDRDMPTAAARGWTPSSARPRSSAPTTCTAAGATSPSATSTNTSASAPWRRAAFVGSPPMLSFHLADEHAASILVRFGRERRLDLQLARRWHALLADEGGLFLLSLRDLSALTAVALVCVRATAGAAAAPQYGCRLALELPGGGGGEEEARVVVMESKVGSSSLSGRAPDYGTFVGAHELALCGGTLTLSVRIDQLSSSVQPAPPPPPPARASPRLRQHELGAPAGKQD